ncbi:MAG: CDP-alcohol phosphatidyltransferase family protein [Anaerolineae bacterium]|nr:CDP-alcohol phosphatidyltransferase family protein [Gemmatimonadaceae bacterium]
MPKRVNSDHLTLLGFFAMAMAGAFYALSKRNPNFLHLVNVSLALNWFGDSLDGSLARYRNRLRPRYGFYVDHIVDTYGVFFLIGGLMLSGYMSERVGLWLLIAYYAVNINIYLVTYVLGVFKISFGWFGGSELRILLAVANLILLVKPAVTVSGKTFLLFDLIGVVAVAVMTVVLVFSSLAHTRKLYELERLD